VNKKIDSNHSKEYDQYMIKKRKNTDFKSFRIREAALSAKYKKIREKGGYPLDVRNQRLHHEGLGVNLPQMLTKLPKVRVINHIDCK
jgi:hypothetical protein